MMKKQFYFENKHVEFQETLSLLKYLFRDTTKLDTKVKYTNLSEVFQK